MEKIFFTSGHFFIIRQNILSSALHIPFSNLFNLPLVTHPTFFFFSEHVLDHFSHRESKSCSENTFPIDFVLNLRWLFCIAVYICLVFLAYLNSISLKIDCKIKVEYIQYRGGGENFCLLIISNIKQI